MEENTCLEGMFTNTLNFAKVALFMFSVFMHRRIFA